MKQRGIPQKCLAIAIKKASIKLRYRVNSCARITDFRDRHILAGGVDNLILQSRIELEAVHVVRVEAKTENSNSLSLVQHFAGILKRSRVGTRFVNDDDLGTGAFGGPSSLTEIRCTIA